MTPTHALTGPAVRPLGRRTAEQFHRHHPAAADEAVSHRVLAAGMRRARASDHRGA